MPDHNITVIDLGLNIQDAIDMQLQCETFTRKKKMAKDLDFNAIEHEYFDGYSITCTVLKKAGYVGG
jgi:hypothetical protein